MPGNGSADRRETRAAPSAERVKAPETESSPAAVNNLGAMLRIMHDSVLGEPVPDRFLELLRQMDENREAVPAALAKKR